MNERAVYYLEKKQRNNNKTSSIDYDLFKKKEDEKKS